MSDPKRDSPKGRGRPKSDQLYSSMTAWVPVTLHDRLIQIAARKGNSLSATIREILERKAK